MTRKVLYLFLVILMTFIIFTKNNSYGEKPVPFPFSKSLLNKTIKIFKYDGTLQCGMGKEVALSEMKNDLEKADVNVISYEKRLVPYFIPTVCGIPTGRVNVYEIYVSDFEKIKDMDFTLWIFDTPTVEVYMYDGTLQCGMGKEITLEVMGNILKEAGIEVLSKRKDVDGFEHIAMCGATTGKINVYEIQSKDFERVLRLGFQILFSGHNRALNAKVSGEHGLFQLPLFTGGEWPFPMVKTLFGGGVPGPFPW